jgi:lipopolysaccharide transport system permease protein
MCLGVSWFLSSLGVYLRDVGQVVGVLITVLMFMSPIFFPLSSLPMQYQNLIMFNPLVGVIEAARDVMYWGNLPSYKYYLIYTLGCSFVAWIGFSWFQHTREGFSDVL